jgi:cellulase
MSNGCSLTGFLVTKYPYESNPPDSIGWTEDATDLGFVSPSDYAGGDIICHKSATNAKATATVSAGGTVTMEWNTWPTTHKGPVIDYLASCKGACATVDKTALEFFKIDEKGLISDTTSPGTWASDNLIANNNSWVITIPAGIASGPYVLRHEIIALHSAGSIDGAQNYPQCINLEVTGGGSDVPAGTLGEALYKDTDPGISINIYTTGLSYTIPGPTLYSGGSGAAATTKAAGVAATSAVASTPTTLATSTITKAPATTSAAAASPDPDTCEL